MKEVLLSVGIDVGTSTTQVIFSNITIENLAGDFSVPRISIVGKEIVYRSEVRFTPLTSPSAIDMQAVREIVREEYRRSGFEKRDVKTGAVVITGETARKDNASEVLRHLSDFAGDFVVATAGPDLESVIAARGAGADEYSRAHRTTAANYDVGGGTSNFAFFEGGELLSTSCLDVGGRLVKLDRSAGTVCYIAPKIQRLTRTKGVPLAVGDPVCMESLEKTAEAMTELLEMSLGLREKSEFYPEILTTPGRDVELVSPLKNLSFSGGVADFIYGGTDETDALRFDDIGVLLGRAIARSERISSINRIQVGETICATVVGAGAHITEISGSTIEYDASLLPIKNLPMLKLASHEEDPAVAAGAIREKLGWFSGDGALQPLAIALTGRKNYRFNELVSLAESIIEGAKPLVSGGIPLVVVVENDIAKALGQTLQNLLSYRHPVICIDSIRASNGDYIDIGTPVGGGSVLPVVIKTLIFQ